MHKKIISIISFYFYKWIIPFITTVIKNVYLLLPSKGRMLFEAAIAFVKRLFFMLVKWILSLFGEK